MKLLPQFNKKFFKLLGILSLGSAIIIIHIIIRFFLERIPHKLSWINPSLLTFVLPLFLLIFHVSIFILILYKFYKIYKGCIIKPTIFQKKLQEILNLLYWNPLKKFHDIIIINIPYSGYLWEDITTNMIYYCNKKYILIIINFTFDFIPRILVSTAFFIDIIFYNQFAFLYILLVLIVFPLSFSSIIYILKHFNLRNKKYLEKFLIIKQTKTNLIFKVKPQYIPNNSLLVSYRNDWLIFTKGYGIFLLLTDLKDYYLPFILLYTSCCYIIGWSYYLWFLFPIKKGFWLLSIFILEISSYIEEPFSGFLL